MLPLDRAMGTSCRLSIVTMSVCSGLAEILNVKFQHLALSGPISETVRDMA